MPPRPLLPLYRHRLRPGVGLLAALAAVLAQGPAAAAVFNFTGASSGSWSQAANWAEGLPTGGADTELVLDAASRPVSFNDIAGGLVLNRLTLGASLVAPVLSGQVLSFQGPGPLLRMLGVNGHAQVQAPMALAGTLTVHGGSTLAGQLFLQGAISGTRAAEGLALASGRTVLSGSNTYSGSTTVAAGAVLGVAGNGLARTSGVDVAVGGELQIVSSNVVTTLTAPIQLGGLLSSSARRVASNFGPVDAAFVRGPVTLGADARILALGATGTGLGGAALNLGGVVDRAGHALTLAADGPNNELKLQGGVIGAGALLIEPGGGFVSVAAVDGDGDVQVRGRAGTVALGSVAGNGRLRVEFDTQSGTSVSVSGPVSGARKLEVVRGNLTLGNAAHSFTGTVLLQTEGMLSVGRDSQLGHAANTLRFEGGGLLRLTDSTGGLSRAIFSTGGVATVDVGTNASRRISGVISGDGGLSFTGTGSLVELAGQNSFAGGLGVHGVVLRFDEDANLGQGGAPILLQSGSLALPAGYTLQRPLSVGSSGGNITGSGEHTLAGPISGSGRLTLGGTGRFTLVGVATHSGGLALAGNAGNPVVLVLDSDARLGAAGGAFDIGRLSGSVVLPGRLEAAADLQIDAARSTRFRDMTVDSAGHTVVFNQALSGLGMTKTGAGTWVLNTVNGDSSAANPVAVEQGRLQLGAVDALGSRAQVVVAGGAELDLSGRSQSLQALSVDAGGRLLMGTAPGALLSLPGGGLIDGSIEGLGSIAVGVAGQQGSGAALMLRGANSFSGSVTVQGGARLYLGHAQALGAPGNPLLLDNGSLAVLGGQPAPFTLTDAQPLQIGSGGAGFQAAGQSLVIEQRLSGSAPLRFEGGSLPGEALKTEVRLMNAGNSFVGDLQLGDARGFGSAVLGIASDGALGDARNRVLLGHSFFDGESTRSAAGGLRAFADLSLPASRTIVLNGHRDGAYSGFIDTQGHTVVLQGGITQASNGLALLKTGEGTLVMNGVHGYTGVTQVAEGTLGGNGELESVQVDAGAALAPGQSAGLLRVRGGLSFNAGLLQLELGGLQRGSGHDALDVGGSVSLGDATLVLDFISGFENTVLPGQSFMLLDAAGGVFGSFANVADGGRLQTVDGEGSFVVHYGGGVGLVISDYVSAVPEPRGWGLMLLGLLAVAGATGRRRSRAD